jgi:hypothetical protein
VPPKVIAYGENVLTLSKIGALGFTLCGALGYDSESSDAVAYASTLATFIGSWAFLVSTLGDTHTK